MMQLEMTQGSVQLKWTALRGKGKGVDMTVGQVALKGLALGDLQQLLYTMLPEWKVARLEGDVLVFPEVPLTDVVPFWKAYLHNCRNSAGTKVTKDAQT